MFLKLFIVISVSAQPVTIKPIVLKIDSILKERGEAYIAIPPDQHKSALMLAEFFSLDNFRNDTAFFYITAKDTSLLYLSGIDFLLLTAPSLIRSVTMAGSIPEVLSGQAYPTWHQYLSIMELFKDEYPDILEIDTIGYSIKNKPILAVRFHTGITPAEERPVVFLSSTMHGDELPGYIILLMLIEELTSRYQNSQDIRNLLDQVILIINPLANPDGTYYLNDSTVYGSKRTNLNNIDLNRNFPDPVVPGIPDGHPIQPENQAMMDYMQKFPPKLSANIHSGAEVVNYPWDSSILLHPDDSWFHFISREFADTARAGHPSYMNNFPGGITNGADWYIIYGGRQDYVTAFLQGREITLEVSDVKIPPASELLYYFERTRQSLINYIKQATYGLHGKVTDEETDEPLKVRINISGHDSGYSFVYSDSITGTFTRFLKEGSYRVIFEHQDYISKIFEINISDYNRMDLHVQLRKNDSTIPPQDFIRYQNPFIGEFTLLFYSEISEKIKVELFTISGQHVQTKFQDVIEGDNNVFINKLPPGIYFLKITTSEKEIVRKIIGL